MCILAASRNPHPTSPLTQVLQALFSGLTAASAPSRRAALRMFRVAHEQARMRPDRSPLDRPFKVSPQSYLQAGLEIRDESPEEAIEFCVDTCRDCLSNVDR